MNQYIITEEQIVRMCPRAEQYCNCPLCTVIREVRSHPYDPQAEREKVLEELDDVTKLEDFLEWIADRLEFVYHNDPNIDFILSLRRNCAREQTKKEIDEAVVKIRQVLPASEWVITLDTYYGYKSMTISKKEGN